MGSGGIGQRAVQYVACLLYHKFVANMWAEGLNQNKIVSFAVNIVCFTHLCD